MGRRRPGRSAGVQFYGTAAADLYRTMLVTDRATNKPTRMFLAMPAPLIVCYYTTSTTHRTITVKGDAAVVRTFAQLCIGSANPYYATLCIGYTGHNQC